MSYIISHTRSQEKGGWGRLPECDKPKQIFIYGSSDFDILCQLLVAPFSKPISQILKIRFIMFSSFYG